MNDPEAVKRLRRRLPSRAERRVTFALKVLATIALALYLLSGVLNFFSSISATGLLIVGALFLAYLIYPLVKRLNEIVPVIWSIVIVYAFIALLGALVVTLGRAADYERSEQFHEDVAATDDALSARTRGAR